MNRRNASFFCPNKFSFFLNLGSQEQNLPVGVRYRSSSVDVPRRANPLERGTQNPIRLQHEFALITPDLPIVYRQKGKDLDCYRVNSTSKCFCNHKLNEHEKYTDNQQNKLLKCQSVNCQCEAFSYVPSRPDEIGEQWVTKRPGFDPTTWHVQCKCNHGHERHDSKSKRCKG